MDYWNKNFTSVASVDNTITIKTIYDPSVSGFALPRTAAFTNFTLSGNGTANSGEFNVSGSFTKGWNFYTNGWRTDNIVFFHALGIRDTYSARSRMGALVFVSEHGRYSTSGANSSTLCYYFIFNSGGVYPHNLEYRSGGLVVRPSLE